MVSREAEDYFNNWRANANVLCSKGWEEEIKRAFDAGVESEKKRNEWHNLEKNPSDLPDWFKPILIKFKNGNYITNNIFLVREDFKFCIDDVLEWKEIE